MRINRFLALTTNLSRRKADEAVLNRSVLVNGASAVIGQEVGVNDEVVFKGNKLELPSESTLLIINKPIGYVCSRNGQGSKTVYDLLPMKMHNLNPIGRLDKDSSGLLVMTDDGLLANSLMHPSYKKLKSYEITLSKPLADEDKRAILRGVQLDDGLSRLELSGSGVNWTVNMHEGRNRQIRRTFQARGYEVIKLHRIQFGDYKLGRLPSGKWQQV